MIRLFFEERRLLLGRPLRLLHLAPEPLLEGYIRQHANVAYLSGDLDPTVAMEEMDVTNIQKPDHSFDAIVCVHVLEHVPDDSKAMREFVRILDDGGWALLQTPIEWSRSTTYEDESVITSEGRLRAFGQEDHVRIYGRDYVDRLSSAGFDVERIPFVKQLSPQEQARNGLIDPDDDIVLCRVRLLSRQ